MKTTALRAYERHGDKLRFLVVGVLNTAFGYGLFVAMLEVVRLALAAAGGPSAVPTFVARNYYLVAQWTAWVLSVPFGTLTLRHWVFHSTGRIGPEIRRAYFVYLPGLALSSAVLWLSVRVLHLPPEIGQLLAIAVTVQFSYLGHKYFTFRVDSRSGTEGAAPAETIEDRDRSY